MGGAAIFCRDPLAWSLTNHVGAACQDGQIIQDEI
jgi:hypothetical protein